MVEMEGVAGLPSLGSEAEPTAAHPPASAEPPTDAKRPARRWVRVVCGARLFGLPLERVREILVPQPLTRLPGCGDAVAGLVGIRGRVVTALDLGRILGSGASASLPDHRLLLVDAEERIIGLAVDDARAVVDGTLRPPVPEQERLAGVDAEEPHILGWVEAGDDGFPALDLDAVIDRHFA